MKLLVCDVEGTIFKAKYKIEGTDYASTMWQPLAQRLGEDAIKEEKETHKKWENKEYNNYLDWVEATVDIHKKYALHVDVFNSLIDEAEYNDGVIEFFKKIDRSKYIPVLVSGGFQELISRAKKELNIKYGYGACEYYFDRDTGLLSSHSMTPCDFEGKYQYVNALFGVYNLNSNRDWVFIGDGKNDVHIAEKAPFAYGINANSELAKIVSLNTNCFSHIYTQMIEDESTYILDDDDLFQENGSSGIEVKDKTWESALSELETTKMNLAAKEAETKLVESEVECLNELLTITSAENQDKEFEIKEFRMKCAVLQNELIELQRKKDAAEKRAEKEEATRRKEIKEFWTLHFRHFSFTENFLNEAAKLLHRDRMKLEEKLLQLHEESDPQKLSQCHLKQTSTKHMRFHLSDGVRARIDYRILNGQQQKIELVEFYKRKDFDRIINNSR